MPRTNDEVARTRMLWAANKPAETAAPAYVPDPPVWWHVALALIAALGIQTSLSPYLNFRGATPSLVVLLVAWYAIRTNALAGLLFGLIAGACEDALAGTTGVAWTFATGLAGFAVGRFSRSWLADTKIALVPGAAIVTIVRYAAFVSFLQFEGRGIVLPAEHLHAALWQSLLDFIIAFAVLRTMPWLGGSDAHRR